MSSQIWPLSEEIRLPDPSLLADLQFPQRSVWKHLIPTLTRSSPRVDSLSSRGSPGAWIVTDLSPRLPSRLLERCLSRRSLQQEARGTGTGQGADLGLLNSHPHHTAPHIPTSEPPPTSFCHLCHLCLRELREWPDL